MSDPIELLFFIPVGIFLILLIDYFKNHCPKCYKWHPFRYGLIILDRHSEKIARDWVKCKECESQWEKIKKGQGEGGL